MLYAFVLLFTLAQTPAPPQAQSPETDWMRQLSGGWLALAGGRAPQAEAAADVVMRDGHARHDAMSLKIRARLLGGSPEHALDAYDQWSDNKRDDLFLLQPIARGVLTSLAESKQPDVKGAALAALARNGDAAARAELQRAATVDGDATLAAVGDAGAVSRLRDRVARPSPGVDQVAAIEALVAAKATQAVPDLMSALDSARPTAARAAAAHGLGALRASDATNKLRDLLNDSDGPVRVSAAMALAAMGDQAGMTVVSQMENSPVLSVRLAAAQVAAESSQSGAWVPIATAALQDPDPLTRLNGVQLLVRYGQDPSAAKAALRTALADTNPAIRNLAAKVMADTPESVTATDLIELKRLLRDASPGIRIASAGTLLRLAGGIE